MEELRYYTGVGSRKTPREILLLMIKIAEYAAHRNWVLRSGHAENADQAFEEGCDNVCGRKEIYLAKGCTAASMELAAKFHPKWDRCGEFARKLHGRNSFQVLGPNLNLPSRVLVCWTSDGCCSHKTRSIATGGTGTAISIADMYNVKIYNLFLKAHREFMYRQLGM